MESRATKIANSPWLHPLFFAAYPIIHFWAENGEEGTRGEALVLLGAAVLLAILVLAILNRLVFRSVEKASVATSVGLLLFFSWGGVYSFVYRTGMPVGRQRFLLPLFCLLLVAVCVRLIRRPESKGGRARAMNTAGAALVVVAASTLWIDGMRRTGLSPGMEDGWIEAAEGVPRRLPDVYYLVLDGYGRGDVLVENFDFDNSAFLDGLRQRGFVIADRSRSNYSWTDLSLASSLNLGLLHGPDGMFRGKSLESTGLRELIRNNRLFRLLGRAGYSRHVIAPREDFYPSPDPPEEVLDCGSSAELVEAFLHTTMARVWKSRWGGFTADRRRQIVVCQFDALRAVVASEGPKLVFFHTLATHPPFLFHADGSPRPVPDAVAREWQPWRPRDHYVDQILFVNRVIGEVIDEILESSPQAVIVVQGDHGPAGSRVWGEDLNAAYRERFGILNAIRMPDAREQIHPQITPVNTFRILVREYLGVAVDNLEDGSFIRDEDSESGFVEVTARAGAG